MDYSRIRVFFKLSLVFFAIIVIRVLYLQFFDETVKKRSDLNMVRTTVIEPSRGKILDRNGKLIIDNQYAYNLYVVPVNFLRSEYSVSFVSEKLNIEIDSLIEEITSPGVYSDRYYRISRDIDFSLYSAIAEKGKQLSGVFVKKEWTRKFEVETAPHIIGYLGEAREAEEIKDDIEYGDLIGKEGIEYIYDDILRGAKGYTKEIRDVKGNKISDYKPEEWKNPVKGKDVYLTIDLDLQLFIEELISKKSATVVVQDCTNGEILAVASKPDYPLSLFSGRLSRSEWKRWSEDPGKPLYNKAIMGLYPPGSVIKMGTVIAAAEQGLKNPEDIVNCPGGMQIGNRFIKCWLHSGHGNVNMLQALMMSCDTYFYDIALSVDVNKWKDTMESFGFGRKTGIDLKYERAGLVPDYDYYRKRIKGDLTGRYANLMIGQGEFLTTPLQISNFTAILAENGKKSTPHLLLKYGYGDEFNYFQKTETDTVVIDPKILKTIKQAMYHVVNTAGGTAHRAKSSIITFAGKTGTAENPHGEDHAWFNSFGPYEDPEIAVTVFEEHGLSGSLASLIAKDIYEFIYTKKSPE
jgi:penicillin-binding protein 2